VDDHSLQGGGMEKVPGMWDGEGLKNCRRGVAGAFLAG
jgi:hypothetical protein